MTATTTGSPSVDDAALRRDLVLAQASASMLRDEVVRQRRKLDRISAVLCDGLGDEPAAQWRSANINADRMVQVAALIEQERL